MPYKGGFFISIPTQKSAAIRIAVSLGGDSDTIAAMTGSLAGAYYGVPNELRKRALTYLPRDFLDILEEFEATYQK